jgi:hypothetical protein
MLPNFGRAKKGWEGSVAVYGTDMRRVVELPK